MKKILFSLFFMCVSLQVINACDKCWSNLIEALIHVESRGQENAVNKNGTCVGVLQIKKILVDECNRLVGYKKYTYQDRYNRKKSIEMFHVIQNYYNKNRNIEKAIRLWNGGPNYTRNKTQKYYNKVLNHFEKQC